MIPGRKTVLLFFRGSSLYLPHQALTPEIRWHSRDSVIACYILNHRNEKGYPESGKRKKP